MRSKVISLPVRRVTSVENSLATRVTRSNLALVASIALPQMARRRRTIETVATPQRPVSTANPPGSGYIARRQ